MNIAQIKDTYTMADIIHRCNLRLHRGNYCVCPFHKGDNTPSLKVYHKSFYCFGCQKGGDIITFVKLFHGLEFKEACEWISGESLDKATQTQIAIAEIERKKRQKKEQALQEELKKVNDQLSGLWEKCLNLAPKEEEEEFPEGWAEAMNKWQMLCYQQEAITEELEGVN